MIYFFVFGNLFFVLIFGGIYWCGFLWGLKRLWLWNCCCSLEGMGGDKNEIGVGGEEKYEVLCIFNEGVINRVILSFKFDWVVDCLVV